MFLSPPSSCTFSSSSCFLFYRFTKIAIDRACVVMHNDTSKCLVQDVMFLCSCKREREGGEGGKMRDEYVHLIRTLCNDRGIIKLRILYCTCVCVLTGLQY